MESASGSQGKKMSFKNLGVKYKLERSGLLFSAAEPFYEVIEKVELTEDIIQDVLDSVDVLLDNNDGNNIDIVYGILKLIRKSAYAEDENFLRQIYYHILRLGSIPYLTKEKYLGILYLAYEDINEKLELKYPYISTGKLMLLFVFGYYDTLVLDKNCTTLEEFQKNIEIFKQCANHIHIPSMLKEKSNFLSFADDENSQKAYKLIIMYPHSDDRLQVEFWGFVFLTLLNEKTKPKIIDYFENLENTNHAEEKDRFARYIAVL